VRFSCSSFSVVYLSCHRFSNLVVCNYIHEITDLVLQAVAGQEGKKRSIAETILNHRNIVAYL